MGFSGMNNLGGMISGLVAIPFIIIAIVFVFLAMRSRRKVSAAQNWPTATGKVTFATVETRHSHSSEGGTTTAHYPKIIYEYTANGQRYQSDRITFGSDVGYGNYNRVLQKVASYPINSMVQVYYNPDNPAEAVLEKTAPSSNLFLIIAIFIVVILACTLTATLGGMSFISNMVSNLIPSFPK